MIWNSANPNSNFNYRISIMANASVGVRCLFLAFCALLVIKIKDISADTTNSAGKKLPPYIKICHRSDPDLNGCVKDSIESLRPMLAKGIPELQIPPNEPLVVPQVVVNQGAGPVSVTSTYSNVHIYGPSNYQIKKLNIDVENDQMVFQVYLPYLNMVSHYRLDGHILALPVKGEGMSYGNYTDVNAHAKINGERIKRDGEVYYHVNNFKFQFDIGHAKITLDNLFDGDKALGASMNMFLNENWRSVLKEIEPILEETIGHLFQDFSNKIFDNYPIKMLLPN